MGFPLCAFFLDVWCELPQLGLLSIGVGGRGAIAAVSYKGLRLLEFTLGNLRQIFQY
jgi:hypothetical protein